MFVHASRGASGANAVVVLLSLKGASNEKTLLVFRDIPTCTKTEGKKIFDAAAI